MIPRRRYVLILASLRFRVNFDVCLPPPTLKKKTSMSTAAGDKAPDAPEERYQTSSRDSPWPGWKTMQNLHGVSILEAAKTNDNKSNSSSKATSSFQSVTGVMSALANGSPASKLALSLSSRPDEPPEGCPPDVEQLGRATWTFLHTTAAYFPDAPTPIQRTRMLGLLMALPVLYPCSHCAQHMGERMKAHPPDLRGGRVSLSRWLCERHNEVNEMLGKPLFDCSVKSTDERWKDGPSDGRCD